MSSATLLATSLILLGMPPAAAPPGLHSLPGPDPAVRRIAGFGGRASNAADLMAPICVAAVPGVPPLPNAVKFWNTHFTDHDLVGVSESLSQITGLRTVDLSYTRVHGETLRWLGAFPSLRLNELDLSSTPISGHGLRELARIDGLESIKLNHTTLYLPDMLEMRNMLGNKLKTLHLADARLLDQRSRPLAPDVILNWVAGFTALVELNLAGTLAAPGSPGESGVGNLTPLIHLRHLTRLDLSNNKLQAPDDPPSPRVPPKPDAVVPLRRLDRLTTLRLGGNSDLNNKSLGQLWPPAGVGVHQLTKLDLSGTKLTDLGLIVLASQNPGLVELNISQTRTMVDRRTPAALRNLAHLCTLNIAGTGVGNDKFRALGDGSGLATLTSLDFSGTMVTDDGLAIDPPHLAVGFRGLLVIYAADTKVTSAGVNHRNALAALVNHGHALAHGVFGFPLMPDHSIVELKAGRMP